ncbi:Solute carrier family 23 member 2 [Holothuria leucospilota]|uniref:Solute carrier family 23 member 2 n=1 Tax=Holothuria leucospilota TaxID=206669 RepID=A0A9Q0YMS1_HOLLE|nr:Solute carrier family 23 member 2 [Holothuria leucospilota]
MDSKEKNTLEHQTQPENRNGFGVTNSSGDHAIDVVHLSSLEESEGEGLKSDLQYGLEETPPWYMCIALGFQHYLTMFGATIAVPLILSNDLCMQDDPVAIGSLIGTIFFVSGLSTILQSTFGNRLPIIQGATFALLPPAQAILKTDGDCPEPLLGFSMEVVHIIIGFTGIIGVFLRFIGPLTIAPTLCLIGLSLFGAASDYAGQNWLLATITIILMVLFSQYLNKIPVPLPGFSSEKKCHIVWVPVFKLFPVSLKRFLS